MVPDSEGLQKPLARPARRPPGWVAPGPPPRLDQVDLARVMGPWEELCYLTGDWRILQRRDGHRWSLDDLVTAWFAAAGVSTAPRRVLDLGCGIGSVLMMLLWRFPAAEGLGIEAQVVSASLARRSIQINGIDGRCRVVDGDLRALAQPRSLGWFELVTGTPPYLPPGTARESARIQRGPCRIEHRGGIEAYCEAAAQVLGEHGRFVTCAGGGQEERVVAAATSAGLTIRRLRAVIPRDGKRPLFSVYMLERWDGEGAQAERPIVEPPLVVRDRLGHWSADFVALREQMGMPV